MSKHRVSIPLSTLILLQQLWNGTDTCLQKPQNTPVSKLAFDAPIPSNHNTIPAGDGLAVLLPEGRSVTLGVPHAVHPVS